jgi:hypothetical protein
LDDLSDNRSAPIDNEETVVGEVDDLLVVAPSVARPFAVHHLDRHVIDERAEPFSRESGGDVFPLDPPGSRFFGQLFDHLQQHVIHCFLRTG